jgi:branched-chain amino acid transport system substrate-binding protein
MLPSRFISERSLIKMSKQKEEQGGRVQHGMKSWRGAVVLTLVVGSGVLPLTIAAGSQSAGAAAAPLSVGVMCSCSGALGGPVQAGEDVYEAWAKSVNASGGLDGHPVTLTLENDQTNPGTSVSEAQTLVSDHVDAILDLSEVDQAWESTVAAAKIPVVGANTSETPFYTNPDFYPEGQTNDSTTYANVVTAKDAGAKNLGDLYCAEAAACAQGVPLIEAAGKQLKVPVVYNAEISATAPNYTAQCVAAQQDKVSSVFVGDASFIIAKVATDCSQQNYSPIWVTEGEGFGPSMQSAPGLKDKLWSEYNTLPYFAKNTQMSDMDKSVNKYFPGVLTNQQNWSQFAAQAWTAGLLLRDAVKGGGLSSSGTPSSSEIVKGLQSLKGDTLDGTAPPLTFAAGKDHHIDCWFTARVENGVPTVINGGKTTCENG